MINSHLLGEKYNKKIIKYQFHFEFDDLFLMHVLPYDINNNNARLLLLYSKLLFLVV